MTKEYPKILLDTLCSGQLQYWNWQNNSKFLIIKIPFVDTLYRVGQIATSQWEEFADGIEYQTKIKGVYQSFRLVSIWEEIYTSEIKDSLEVIELDTISNKKFVYVNSKRNIKHHNIKLWNERFQVYVEFLYICNERNKDLEKYLTYISSNIIFFKSQSSAHVRMLLDNMSLHNINHKIDTIL